MGSGPLSSDHATDALLAAYIDRTLGDPERDALEDHLAGCDGCREHLLAATGTLRGERRRKRVLTTSGAAAVAVAIGGIFVLMPSPTVPGTPKLRGNAYEAPGTPAALEAVSPGDGTTVGDSGLLIWRSVDGATRYRITVSDPESDVVFEKDVADTVFSLRSVGPLVPGGAYVWYVDALLPDGTSVTTGVRSFTVRP